MLKGSMAAAALAFAQYPLSLFGGPEAEEGGVLIPFLDAQPPVQHQTRWQQLTNWHTKSEDLYVVSHYNTPALNAEEHVLEISGLAAYNEHGQEVFPKDLLKQTRYVLDSLMLPILQEAGAGFDDIARLSVFTTSMREWPAVWDQVRPSFHKPPALTVVELL